MNEKKMHEVVVLPIRTRVFFKTEMFFRHLKKSASTHSVFKSYLTVRTYTRIPETPTTCGRQPCSETKKPCCSRRKYPETCGKSLSQQKVNGRTTDSFNPVSIDRSFIQEINQPVDLQRASLLSSSTRVHALS